MTLITGKTEPDLRGRAVLVTGARGFIGRSLVPQLESWGADVISWDRESLKDPAFQSHSLVQERGALACIHLAGNGNVGECERDPEGAFASNVELTGRVLKRCSELGVSQFVFPSTARVYGSGRLEPYTESDPVSPAGVYASTKGLAELLVKRAARELGFAGWILRMTNVYGRESSPETVLGSLLRQAREGRKSLSLERESPVRDFIFIADVGEAIGQLLAQAVPSQANPSCEVLNLSTGTGTRIGDLGATLAEVAGVQFESRDSSPTEPGDQLVLSPQKLRGLTGWRPKHSLRDGLQASL